MANYNGIRLELKSTMPLSVGLFATMPSISTGLYFADVADYGQKELQHYELPLELFRASNGRSLIPECNLLNRIAIVAKGQNNVPFQFWVKSATLVYSEELEKIRGIYKENVMFRRKNSYVEEGIETGSKRKPFQSFREQRFTKH